MIIFTTKVKITQKFYFKTNNHIVLKIYYFGFKRKKKDNYMKLKKLLLLLLFPLIFLTGCKGNELDNLSKDLNTYTINITYNDNHTLTCSQTINYKNRTGTSLENIMFHLYPRSFRQGAKSSVVSSLNYNSCYYNGANFGDIEITKLQLDNEDKDIVLCGDDEDILNVTSSTPIAPDKELNFYMEYTVTLPNINHRFGYGEDTINIANFYPILCIYENGEYNTSSYHYNGDPFYSEVANYNVTLSSPSNLLLASTGNIASQSTDENTTTYNINAHVVRDFAFVLSDKFNVVSGNYNDIEVNYYYYNNQYPSECLQASIDALQTFEKLFGKYPYTILNVVETDFVHGGMEYPNLVYISDTVDVQSDYINVIVHEIAHQWWYGIVGNDEYHYGWLDEGLTEYSTLLFYEENPQYNVDTKTLIKNTTNSYVTFVDIYTKVFDQIDTSMNRKLNEYSNESEYVYIAYVKGMLLFDNLKEVLGRETFLKGLQTYYEDNKFQIATPDSLINAFEKASNNNLRSFFESWINGNVKIMQIN